MHGKIRLRAVLLGIAIGLLVCAFTPFNNAYLNATLLGGGHFPLAPFFILAWLTVFVAGAQWLTRGRPLFTGLELMTTWILSVMVSGVAYTGLARTFFINITAPFYFATVGNRWQEVLQPLLPEALHPADPGVIETLYNGIRGGATMSFSEIMSAIPWGAWVGPLLVWGGFILLCYLVMLCIVNIFSRQWVVNERINFPLIRLPQVMEEALSEGQMAQFFMNRYLLMGLMASVFLHTLNGLHFYNPSVPDIPTLLLAGKYFPKYGMLSGFNKLKIHIYPAFIGFAFLAPRQISFSFWVFFIAGCYAYGILSVLGLGIPPSELGVTFGPTLAHVEETQMIGAYGVFFLFIIWLARRHLIDVFKSAVVPGAKKINVENEWFSLRLSFWGAVIGGAGLVGWCAFFGLPVLPAVLLIAVFFMVMLVATKVICQGGIAYFTLTAAPTDGLLALFGPKLFGAVGLAVAAMVQKVLFVDLRESLMPSLTHGSKVAEWIKNKRLMLWGIVVILALSIVVSFTAMLYVCYKYGVRELNLEWATRTSTTVYENVQRLIEAPDQPTGWVLTYAGIGAAVMLVLVVCYQRFPWWPIHPIGYLTAYSSAMRILWFSFFVGWLCNQLSLRYGGVLLFKRIRFLFFGFILGDFLMGGIWALYGLWYGLSYQVLPN